MSADGDRGLVGLGTVLYGAVDDLKGHLVDILHELDIKFSLALESVGLLQPLCQRGVAADIDAEAADGPEQEFDVPLHIAVIRLPQGLGSVNFRVMHGDLALVALDGDGQGLFRALFVGVDPDAEGNEVAVQAGEILYRVFNAQVIHR